MLDLDNVTEAIGHPDDKWLALTMALGLALMLGTALLAI